MGENQIKIFEILTVSLNLKFKFLETVNFLIKKSCQLYNFN